MVRTFLAVIILLVAFLIACLLPVTIASAIMLWLGYPFMG